MKLLRSFALTSACLLALSFSTLTQAQGAYPDKPISIWVGFPPGTSTDSVGRILADKMSKDLGQPIIIKNKPGVGGTLAPAEVAKSQPDGYTLLLSATAPMGTAAHLMKNLPYSPLTDFAPIGQTSWLPFLLVSNKTKGLDTFEKYIAYAKAKPEALTYASIGNGTTSHLVMLTLLNKAGVKMVHVPYQGSTQSQADVIGGNVDATFDTMVTVYPHVVSGRLNALAVSTKGRTVMDPSVPTVEEKGIPDFNLGAWIGLFAVKGTPKPIVEKLFVSLNRALADPEISRKLVSLGTEVVVSESPAAFGQFVALNYKLWGEMVELSGLEKK
ncbi:MAG: transcriptional initiation protein Tat [Alcaligenaceae bacterium]|nr:MAG: transcriptional initiation protein Tat [Alcaligenaceae bacterium]